MTQKDINRFFDAFKYAIGPCYTQLKFSQERCIIDGKETISFKLQVGVSELGLWTCLFTNAYMSEASLADVVQGAKRDFLEAISERKELLST